MFDKIIKYIVYFLGLLIIIALFAVIYGMYLKTSTKASKNYIIDDIVSLSLNKNQEIKNIKVIDNNRILITIGGEDEVQAIIFDIDRQEIIQRITK